MTRIEIFNTVHGSHLYGLAGPGSDMDVYRIYEGQGTKLRQSTNGSLDIVRGDLDAVLERAANGSHQSLEALFSPFKVWGEGMEAKWGSFLKGLRFSDPVVFRTYERTIRKFSYGDYKRRRHAARLRFNLSELRMTGRINPRLTPGQVKWASWVAEREGDDLVGILLD